MSMHSLYIWTDKWQRIPLRYEIDLNSEPNRTQGNPIVYMFYNRYNHFNTLNIFGSSHNLFIFSLRFHCRYNFAKQRIQERIAREGIKNKILYESTHLDPERKLKSSNNSWATLSVENPKRTTYSSGAPQMYILCSIKKKLIVCELYILSHLHENLSGLGASTVCLLYTAQLSCQKTRECETFLCVECTKPNWRKNCTSTRISITGPTAVRMTQRTMSEIILFFILQQDCFPFDHHEGWGADSHNYPVNDGFHTYMYN